MGIIYVSKGLSWTYVPHHDPIANIDFPRLWGHQIKSTYSQSKRGPKVSIEIRYVPVGHSSLFPWQLLHSQWSQIQQIFFKYRKEISKQNIHTSLFHTWVSGSMSLWFYGHNFPLTRTGHLNWHPACNHLCSKIQRSYETHYRIAAWEKNVTKSRYLILRMPISFLLMCFSEFSVQQSE